MNFGSVIFIVNIGSKSQVKDDVTKRFNIFRIFNLISFSKEISMKELFFIDIILIYTEFNLIWFSKEQLRQ